MGRSVMLALALSSIGCNQVFGIAPLGPCRDEDGDGYDTCLPDCDDTNAALRPDQPEICGNNLDDDCDGTPDQYCQGLGTFVSSLIGDDANPGTQEKPLKTLNKALAQAQQIGHGVDVYVGEGFYNEDIALVEGVSLFGGYVCKIGGCNWQERILPPNAVMSCITPPLRDVNNVLVRDIDGVTADASITRDTVLDGMCIDNAFGWDLGPRIASFTIDGGAPIFRNSFIGEAWWLEVPCETGYAVEILSSGDTPPLFESSEVRGPDCGDGVMAAFQLSGNAAVEIRGGQFGVLVGRQTYAMRLQGQSRAVIHEGNIRGGDCPSYAMIEHSFSVRIEDSAQAVIDRTYINSFFAPLCGANDGDTNQLNNPWLAGVGVAGGKLSLTNSIVHGFHTPRSSAIWVGAGADTDVLVNGNILIGTPVGPNEMMLPAPMVSAAIVVEGVGGDYAAGRFRNNVLRGGTTDPLTMTRYGVFEQGQGAHPRVEALGHNNIVDVDVAYRSWNGVSEQLLTTVAELTSLSFATDNFADDCLIDIEFHLAPNSPCIDRGTAEEAPDHDFEGEPRPNGTAVDVGVDEFRAR